MWRTVRLVCGFTLIAVGGLGLLLPVIPGIPLLIAGAAMVGFDHPWIRPAVARLKRWRAGARSGPR